MKLFKALELSEPEIKIFNSLLAGGNGWESYKKAESKEPCLGACPFIEQCKGHGPDGICSDNWKNSEFNVRVASVLLHVLDKFDHYNQGDLKNLHAKSGDVRGIRSKVFIKAQDFLGGGDTYREGDLKSKWHQYRERNSSAAREKKENAYADGELICEACGVNYGKLYKEKVAFRVVECHHDKPLSSPEHGGETSVSDLKLLCANCHRIVHSEEKPIQIKDLKKIIKK